MYQRIGKAAYKENLDNTIALAQHLGNPEKHFKSVHVGGTNGKGSTSHVLAAVLQEAGYKVGLYTSPHLKDFRERIKINGRMIPQREVVDFLEDHKDFFQQHQLSFFEMTVGLAFHYFKKQQVDIAIVEVGMGGRLDSTNILHPEVSVITNIGLDHTRFLGDTLEQIAKEKAGIIKEGVPVIIGEWQSQTHAIFETVAESKGATISFADKMNLPELESDLKGIYQKKNKTTALAAIQALQELDWDISEENIINGFKKVIPLTGMMGRWQVLRKDPMVICDTAHNREGLEYVMEQLKSMRWKQLHMVIGTVSDKDLDSLLSLFPKDAHYYFCAADIGRALPADQLQHLAQTYGLEGESFDSVQSAYTEAVFRAEKEDVVFVGGSTFVVAEVL